MFILTDLFLFTAGGFHLLYLLFQFSDRELFVTKTTSKRRGR